jgi:hypothetical protein
MENRRRLTAFGVLFLVGIILAGSGAALVAVSSVKHSSSPGLEQYAEFWVVARSGGGLGTNSDSDLYVKTVPLSADPGDLRVWDLAFNISASQSSIFIPTMQFFAAFSAPNFAIFNTTWLENLSHTLSDQETQQLFEQGLATPHNITLYYFDEVLQISANNTVYNFTLIQNVLGRDPNMTESENSSVKGGMAYPGYWQVNYLSDGTFMFYVPDPSQTVLHLGFNMNENLSFSMRFCWNMSFEQEYGSGLRYAGNATIANWVFTKIDADTIGVSIDLNNTNYRGPIPAFTVVPSPPLLETSVLVVGLIVVGLIVSVVGFIFWRKFPGGIRY